MNAAKVQISKEELALVSDPRWILTKNSIMGKVVEMMGGLSADIGKELEELRIQLEVCSAGFIPPANWDRPKISKGENYNGLPYVILDLPRVFKKDGGFEHFLAIRTMFWWGNYFSVTLHLKGFMLDMHLHCVRRHWQKLSAAGFLIATTGDEWAHELEGGHYAPMIENDFDQEKDNPFLKLSAKVPLDKWNDAPALLLELSKLLLHALTN